MNHESYPKLTLKLIYRLRSTLIRRGLLEKVHLAVVGKYVQQARIFEFELAVGAQGDALGELQGQEKIFEGFTRAGAFGVIAQGLGAADTVGEFVQVFEPFAHLRAVMPGRKLKHVVKVGCRDDFGAMLAFQYFQVHICLLLRGGNCFETATKINELFLKTKCIAKNLSKRFVCIFQNPHYQYFIYIYTIYARVKA